MSNLHIWELQGKQCQVNPVKCLLLFGILMSSHMRTTLQVMGNHPKPSVLTSTTPPGRNTDRPPSSRFSTFSLPERMQTVPAYSRRIASTIPRNTRLTSTHHSPLKSLFMDTGEAFNQQHFVTGNKSM